MVVVNLEWCECGVSTNNVILLAPDNMSEYDVNKISTNIGIQCSNDTDSNNSIILFKEYGFTVLNSINCYISKDC